MCAAKPSDLDSSSRSYRPDIDGLRAVAILSVAFYHAGVPAITGGFTGVDIFFTISGYLIGGQIYADLRGGSFSYLRFYRRRAKRILPAFFAVLAFILLAALLLLSPQEAAQTARSAFAATLSASNILFWMTANYFTPKTELNPVLMTWSLGVEEQFYVLIPLVMVVLVRVRRNWLLPAILATCALSFLIAWSELGRTPMMAFYLLPARAWELGIGVALAAAELNRTHDSLPIRLSSVAEPISLAGVASLLAPVFLLTTATPFPGPAALPSVLGTAMVLCVPGSWINRRVLSLPPLTFVGRISYSWYLWHWPLLAYLRIVYGGDPPPSARLLAIIASLGLAVLSYYFIEQPFRRSARPPAPLLFRYVLASFAALAVCAVVWLTHGLPQRFPKLARVEAVGQTLKGDPCLVGDRDQPDLSSACIDVSAARPSVAIWGDSHAAALAPGLRAAANARGYGLVELSKNSCPPLIGATHYVPLAPLGAEACIRFNRKTLALLEADRRVPIVILTASWAAPFNRTWMDGWLTSDVAPQSDTPSLEASSQLFTASLSASIGALQASGKEVIVLEDTPNFSFDPMLSVRTAHIPARRALALWLGAKDAADVGVAPPAADRGIPLSISLLEETARLQGVTLLDPKPALCSSTTQCAYRDGDSLLFIDSSHVSPEGASRALRDLRLPAPSK